MKGRRLNFQEASLAANSLPQALKDQVVARSSVMRLVPLVARTTVHALACISLATASSSASAANPSTEPIEADWRAIAETDLLVMSLPGDRRVVIRLAPDHAPEHVANIRALAASRWWDGTSIYRVHDNFVTQWGGATQEKPLPENVLARPKPEFDFPLRPMAHRLRRSDAYSLASGISADGWPLATNGAESWIPHCYGTVAVARGHAPDTGTGSELFVVIGGSARSLDRNYTVVGRVIEGMEYLSALPRSRAPLGFYATEAERTPLLTVRLANDVPEAERPRYQYRTADNPRFAAMIAGKEQPPPPTVALGGIDICDVPLRVRSQGAP